MTRRPLFWGMLAALSLVGGWFALTYYAEAFPLLSVDLRMSRGEALEAAASRARSSGLAPADFRQAASFGLTDPEVQTYIELEGGGPQAYARLVDQGPYRPYVWEVRHFAEGEVAETHFRFTPEGEPYGFRETLAEDEPRPSLSADAARALAAADAANAWGVQLSEYAPLETSAEARPGGRVDHTFVYERTDVGLGDASVRLRLVVAGDRLSELTHFVHVPDAFLRRYREMRSANDTLALISNLIFIVVFLILIAGVGTFFLLRRGWVIWRAPLLWGFGISVLMALGTLNQLPLAWMGYDTAVSRSTFLLQQIGAAVVIVVFGTALLAFVFLAAEGLTRRAFPRQPQQWRLTSRGVLNSDAVLGRTLGGYLWAGVDLGFVVAFYLVVSRLEGWWMPSETMLDPDLLATPFPWVMALSLSLFAAFWEESLFRAVPLAGAKLLGDRFGGTRVWIIGALLLQAVVFAAAHANYPQMPSYARIAELFLPALLWGVFYLYFGLLPVILIHFLHNFTFFSVVIFSADDPGLWPDRVISVLLMLTPLAAVLIARRRWGRVRELPDGLRNVGWVPAERVGARAGGVGAGVQEGDVSEASVSEVDVFAADVDATGPRATAPPVPARLLRALPVAAALGVALWVTFLDPGSDAPALSHTRSEAITLARNALAARGIQTGAWEAVAFVESAPDAPARFVWEAGGEDAYQELLGSHLDPPQWLVRFVRFTGPVEERAEEWRVIVGPEGEIREVTHRLPEEREGPALDETDARARAAAALAQTLAVGAGALREISAEAVQRPARRDWTFTYAVPGGPQLGEGERRIRVEVAGDEVVSLSRFVHVPESWERAERQRATRSSIVALGAAGLLVLLLLAAAVAAVLRWSRGSFAVTAAAWTLIGLAALQTASALNGYPAALAGFTTAEPVRAQLFALAASLLVLVLVAAGTLGLVSGLAHSWLARMPSPRAARPAWVGGMVGLALAGALAAVGALAPEQGGPEWASYGAAEALFPLIQSWIDSLSALIAGATLLLLLIGAVERVTHGWTRRRVDATVALLWLGVLLSGIGFELRGDLMSDLARWIGGGLAMGAALGTIYWLSRRFGPAIVPVLCALLLAANRLEGALGRPYPQAMLGALTAVLVTFAAALLWSRVIEVGAWRPTLRSSADRAAPRAS